MGERQMWRRIFVSSASILLLSSATVIGQEYCTPDQYCQFPPEANVSLSIGSPCDSTETLNIPIYLDNPCPVSGFQMRIVLTDTNADVYFDPDNPDVADTVGSRITGWGHFTFNVINSTTLSIVGVGPGGSEPILAPGEGLIFTVHPSKDGPVNLCQTVRFGAVDYVYDSTGYCDYPIDHNLGTLCVGCDPSWVRGDANRSGTLNIADVIALFSHLRGLTRLCFGGCICTGDYNNNGVINIADVIEMFAFLKGNGNPPDPCD